MQGWGWRARIARATLGEVAHQCAKSMVRAMSLMLNERHGYAVMLKMTCAGYEG